MKAAMQPRLPVPPPSPSSVKDRSKTIRNIRRLIWLYLILLIFEGALRKWVVPQYSNPLLIVRDPVVILIYILALRARCFPWNSYVISLAIIGLLSWISGIIVLQPYLPIQSVFLVTGYGFRSNFLHLPLIFVIPAVFDFQDVKRIGWWTIVGMIPIAVLMAFQFNASPESFINRAAGLGEGQQIQTSGGKIRPPATFSFISGAIFYLSAAAGFLLHAALSKLEYKTWILFSSALSLIVAVGVSGSRGAVLAVALVVASLGVILLFRPDAMTKFGRNLLLALILAWAVSHVPIFREGVGVLSERFTESAEAGETTMVKGLFDRTLSGFTEPFSVFNRLPLAGYGLGVGTNAAARFLVGRSAFLLAENEWTRILLESGSILGLAFLIWRTLLTLWIGYLVFRQLRLANTLPLFLFAAGAFALINGSFGQPTSLGFAVVLAGLCLAAMKGAPAQIQPEQKKNRSIVRRVPGRSVYAGRLHGAEPDHTNGSLDR
jgi:hypothetical protein